MTAELEGLNLDIIILQRQMEMASMEVKNSSEEMF